MAGLDLTGLTIKSESEIVDELEAAFRAAFGANLPLGADTIFGQIVAIVAEREAILWELLEVISSSQNPDSAVDALLEALAALTGTERLPAIGSNATLTLTGTPTTVVAIASQAKIATTGEIFGTDAEATIATLPAWTDTTVYAVGSRVFNGTNTYECTIAGTSAGSGGPVLEVVAEVDGTVTWQFMGDGTGAVDVASTAIVTGPTIALARTITDIETPVAGWDSVINLLDAVTGRNIETDEDLRARRETDLARAGKGTPDAIRTDVLAVDGVTSVTVFPNVTDVTDPDGVPPHAVEVVVEGGLDQDIFDALGDTVCAGILQHGSTTGTWADDEGASQPAAFSRPTVIPIWIEVTLIKDPDVYPATGDTLVETAIVEAANRVGLDAVSSRLSGEVSSGNNKVTGILDLTILNLGLASSPTTEGTVLITSRELADYDTTRILVFSSDGTP